MINNITVHKDATGDFSILIEHHEGYAGALDWNEGNLQYAGGTSTVTGVKIAGVCHAPCMRGHVFDGGGGDLRTIFRHLLVYGGVKRGL